jgi:hypothetical protein
MDVPITTRVQADALSDPASQDPLDSVLRSLAEATHEDFFEKPYEIIVPEM